ncbi:MAG TPA: WYL domain-containing protein [Brevundimonas sp.]|uniref:helix-turn-helix transcriptional regulator n=1 Tax=Brevundimonas sp. TaxID=1871086 RepID=UPI002C4254AF|nr:WYL domain-containing protein [Brevundimonas sp.]HRH19943.1 WYL domain-containing protein [Brevundimonas sp.]
MRHDKAAIVLDLARRMAASAEGLTLDEMARDLEVGRRTAERLRDAVLYLFPQAEEVSDPPTKRWRIRDGLSAFQQAPTTTELLELTKAAEALRRQGEGGRAAVLETLERKIRAAMRSTALNRIAPDLEALVRAETIAVQAGPRPFEHETTLAAIRHAIMAGVAISFIYNRGSRPGERREVAPCGLMFGRANYLVAAEIGSDSPKTFRLDGVADVQVLSRPAAPPEGFDLTAFANRSFGIYQDAVEDVVLTILPAAAAEAKVWRFHPTQTLTDNPDGSVTVRFSASGMRELAWHLFTWGENVRVVGPDRLKQAMAEALEAATRAHQTPAS